MFMVNYKNHSQAVLQTLSNPASPLACCVSLSNSTPSPDLGSYPGYLQHWWMQSLGREVSTLRWTHAIAMVTLELPANSPPWEQRLPGHVA